MNKFKLWILSHNRIFYIVSISFTISIISLSCGSSKKIEPTKIIQDSTTINATIEEIPTKISLTLTPIVNTPTITPTKFVDINDEFYKELHINVTQGPIIVASVNAPESTFLYKDVVVDFQMTEMQLALIQERYLNLDNINDNNVNNSDILIRLAIGSGGIGYKFFPVNFAKYYFSGQNDMDYDKCVSQFPVNSIYDTGDEQTYQLGSGKPYCILTNEGRMAIVKYVKNSDIVNDEGVVDFSILITVYQKKVDDIFTPAPTETPGPSPTPTNRYSGNNLSNDQADILDGKIQDFINAVTSRDQNSILQMASYPLVVRIGTDEIFTLESSNEFIAIYDKLMTDQFVEEISKATIDENVVGKGLCLDINNGKIQIYFTKEGKILSIVYLP